MKSNVRMILPALLLTGCVSAPEAAFLGDPVAGAQVASDLCASCHAVGSTGASPNPQAPPLRTVLASYPAELLATDLRNSVSISHLKMPTFYFGPEHADDVVAYLRTIQMAEPAVGE